MTHTVLTPFAFGFAARIAIVATALVVAATASTDEIAYPAGNFAKLDTFVAMNLEEADKLYAKGDFSGAYAGSRADLREFTKIAALPTCACGWAAAQHSSVIVKSIITKSVTVRECFDVYVSTVRSMRIGLSDPTHAFTPPETLNQGREPRPASFDNPVS